MAFLEENRTVIIIIAVIVIAYLLLQTDMFQNLLMNLQMQWAGFSDVVRLIIVVLVIWLVYWLLTRNNVTGY